MTEGAQGGGYTFSNANCVVNTSDANDPTTATGGLTSTIHIGNGGEVTCTYVNVLQRSLIISKVAKDASTPDDGQRAARRRRLHDQPRSHGWGRNAAGDG